MSSIPFAVHSLNPFDRIENSAHCWDCWSHTHPDSAEAWSSVPVFARSSIFGRRPSRVPWLPPGSESRSTSPHGAASAAQSRWRIPSAVARFAYDRPDESCSVKWTPSESRNASMARAPLAMDPFP